MSPLIATPEEVEPLPEEIIRQAELSPCGSLRFTLSRTWRAGPHVCFIGLNPSTADASKDDPTVRRWTHFAHAWGYGGFTAVNVFPVRSAKVADCRAWADWEKNGPDFWARDRIHQNLGIVAREAKRAGLVVACWGAQTWAGDWIDQVIEEVQAGYEPWPDLYCFGLTKAGDPKHPMARGRDRIPNSAQPVIWKKSEA
ncbi:MAG: DUF1643 domain-containing protein [Magnetovibrionaceae bacterium]